MAWVIDIYSFMQNMPFCSAIYAILGCNMCHFAVQYGMFWSAKCAVLQHYFRYIRKKLPIYHYSDSSAQRSVYSVGDMPKCLRNTVEK